MAATTTAAASGEESRRRRPEARPDRAAATPESRDRGLVQHRDQGRDQGLDLAREVAHVPGPDLEPLDVLDRGRFRGLVQGQGRDLRPRDDPGRARAAGRDRFHDRALVQDLGRLARSAPGQALQGPGRARGRAQAGRGLVLLPEKEVIRINLLFCFDRQFFFCENKNSSFKITFTLLNVKLINTRMSVKLVV